MLNLGVRFPAVRSLTLLSLADPLLSVASTAWMSAVQRLRSAPALASTHGLSHIAVIRASVVSRAQRPVSRVLLTLPTRQEVEGD